MKLRPLDEKDADLMFEWMHDDDVVHFLDKDFSKLTIEDARNFIEAAVAESKKDFSEQSYVHMGIADDNDEYQGTVSLKNIDGEEKIAEFGISIRTKAMGHGFAIDAMKQIIKLGFTNYGLEKIFWYVNADNKRALRFYEKNGYTVINEADSRISRHVNATETNKYIWFLVEKNDAQH